MLPLASLSVARCYHGFLPFCAHLKWASKSKREGSLKVPLLWAPALAHFVVADQHLLAPLIEAGVDVKGNVIASQKIHCEPVDEDLVT